MRRFPTLLPINKPINPTRITPNQVQLLVEGNKECKDCKKKEHEEENRWFKYPHKRPKRFKEQANKHSIVSKTGISHEAYACGTSGVPQILKPLGN